jgi:hypothetical protein
MSALAPSVWPPNAISSIPSSPASQLRIECGGLHQIDLLVLVMAMPERQPLTWLERVVRDPDLLRTQRPAGEPRLADLIHPVLRSHILDLADVDFRVFAHVHTIALRSAAV